MQSDGSKALYAGGILLFIGFIAGSATGIAYDQASLGAMAGVGVAALLALLLWVRAKR
jgi:prepilin signal peptidase PulO-like enzyme (type II secretory pathway)